MIFDAFIFNDELDLLEIRLNTLDPVVDRFILVEMGFTHSMKPKPFFFERHRARFRRFLPRIEHVKVYDCPYSLDPFKRERHQRNAILRGLRKAQDNDIITLCDVDEIPRPNVYEHFHLKHRATGVCNLNMRLYFYWLNGLVCEPALYAKIMTGWFYNRSVPEEIRYWSHHDTPVVTIQDAGFHWTWLGNPGKAIKKLDQGVFHKDTGIEGVRKGLMNGDFQIPGDGNGNFKVTPVEIDESWPDYVLKNIEKYRANGWIAPVKALPRNSTGTDKNCSLVKANAFPVV